VKLLAVGLFLELILLITKRFIEAERKKQNRKAEIERRIADLEIKALQAQMNPHFIFNCISGIQFYILSNRTDEVLDYLADFSKVVRESLANATLRIIPLDHEIDFLHCYLRLEQMRFPDKFEYRINYLDGEDAGFIFLPPMLVQPFAENAISHGFSHLESKGQLSIVFGIEDAGLLKCTILDNGKGREKADRKDEVSFDDSRPHSTKITETRVRLFNPAGNTGKYQIVYTDLIENGTPCGLKVELFLPMERGYGQIYN
jgi:sensor histidine kinase YesM